MTLQIGSESGPGQGQRSKSVVDRRKSANHVTTDLDNELFTSEGSDLWPHSLDHVARRNLSRNTRNARYSAGPGWGCHALTLTPQFL